MKALLLNILLINLFFGSTIKAKEPFTFPNWKTLETLNPLPYRSDNHNAWVDIYVNQKASKAYKQQSSKFPVGSVVIKSLFDDYNQTRFKKIAIMVKMPQNYDTNNSDWWYGLYDELGTKSERTGKMFDCIDCHEVVRETDFMFSEDVMDDIKHRRYMHPNDL